ncbi:NnrS family protein [Rhodobacter ferrooxidans]|uniref:NnrS family protein n=1 Tax=Rhodobacter ferrooxidans TaxID=371731 RepID=C8RWH4_9RHOB|nr:NnrS family protein [Rhodobacter sp. SW2]EEW26917.1 NnrS family protein [Rhodobacter sp. SW2]
MTTSAEQMRAWRGPVILSQGYRPFFLLAALWAVLVMGMWVLVISGALQWQAAFEPVTWHAHALLFGYTTAVIAGFLMTAVPNWTGRFPITGWPVAGLAALWLTGRAVVTLPLGLPALAVAVVDLAFPVVLALAIGREIVAGRNWRNLKVLGLLGLLILADGLFHWQAAHEGAAAAGFGARLGLAVLVVLIALIGGRVVPSFTRNWLAQRRVQPLPAAADRLDDACMAITVAAAASWAALPDAAAIGGLCLLAGVANLWRLARWQGHRTLAEPLVWVLHASFAFVALGFFSVGAEALGLMALGPASKHVWMAGAVGLMTLAVMSRASLGHGGYPLAAGKGVALLYAALICAVLARVLAGFWPQLPWLLHIAAGGWILAFGGFALLFWPILARPKLQPRRAG